MPSFPRSTAFRTFSALSRTKAAVRSMEPHPFSRRPITMEGAKGDWSGKVKNAVTTTAFFLPSIGLFLSWPIIAGKSLNGHM